jgi:hypothetical protein
MKQFRVTRAAMLLCVAEALVGCASAVDFPERSTWRVPAQQRGFLTERWPNAAIHTEDKARSHPGGRGSVARRSRIVVEAAAPPTRSPAAPHERDSNIETPSARQARWKAVPPGHKPTPEVNSPEWKREHAEAEKKDRELDQEIRSICQRC